MGSSGLGICVGIVGQIGVSRSVTKAFAVLCAKVSIFHKCNALIRV